ncbi:hypothetical protein HS961_20410 [Comamonas piscis]|uniref:Uncharacterized protein n=1 Tax=Comamonas piscis TaxID=1562974 RepID=A0A7G5ELY8_9BURK|nr:hypothetical protein [Comamonas piscis]QMV75013.1 hypothetical protein HS961_20410 [Comamonas piscis]WSO33493.1 hypothetical protein VUJ63_20475 [Comamonas piscis]
MTTTTLFLLLAIAALVIALLGFPLLAGYWAGQAVSAVQRMAGAPTANGRSQPVHISAAEGAALVAESQRMLSESEARAKL